MSMRMLIDARHPEETRVAVVKGNRIEEFDFESAEHKQLKGNIYLAKVTRVEPSLQAAFIDYGGNRHGFLAFSEIHPDYYQIPKADREALLREEAEHAAEEERLRAAADDDMDGYDDHHDDDDADDRRDEHFGSENDHATGTTTEAGTGSDASPVDESAVEQVRKKRQALRRRYKIQDVVQRRQVLLVQVVKEERGNKGAALTTYLSLAGRYCVLMPNTSHGGGISRKISNSGDRKRLKSIMSDLKLPQSMGLIVRTAGLERTKTEIKRDFDYLARLWDEIREKTLSSSAPALIYRDSDLVKRAIRDLYHREIDEVLVEGEDGYKQARNFMKLLMPSHVKRVRQHSESTPLFQRYGAEDQLSAMYQPIVQLKSGGYLVINPTEALVSIDINSGRSTREHNIEQTAFMTNLEAAQEIARQLRLRDMAGLVVIDFIDMEQHSHNRKVEKAMKEALKNDRARIQVGRISSFGLMEMSRQRLRTGVLEASTKACPHCEGTGLMRTASSAGLSALRMIEDEAARGKGSLITLRAGREAAVYVLNKKRSELAEIELRYGVSIDILIDEQFEGAKMTVDSAGPRPATDYRAPTAIAPVEDDDDMVEISLDDDEDEDEDSDERDRDGDSEGSFAHDDKSRRRRRRRGGRGRGRRTGTDRHDEDGDEPLEATEKAEESETDERRDERPGEDDRPRRGRRGRRGGRGRRPRGDAVEGEVRPDSAPMIDTPVEAEAPLESAGATEEQEKPKRKSRSKKADVTSEPEAPAADEKPKRKPRAKKADAGLEPEADSGLPAAPAAEEKPKRKSRAKKAEPASEAVQGAAEPVAQADKETAADAKPKRASRAKKADASAESRVAQSANDGSADDGDEPRRGGWWQRTFG